jgi:hypothetical protein
VIGKEAFNFALDYFNGVVTGLQNNEEVQLYLFPNPLSHDQVLHMSSNQDLWDAQLVIMDVFSRTVMKEKIDHATIQNGVSLEGLSSGLYLVNVNGESFSITRRIIVP